MFSAASKQSPMKPARRTMLNHSRGQIVTEEDVIKQLEEKEKSKDAAKQRFTSRKSNDRKRHKT